MARKNQQTPTPKATTKPADTETLKGSNTLPAHIEITEGVTIPLGDLVMLAHKQSGLSVDAWNALPEGERDGLLNKEIEEAKSALAAATSDTTSSGPQTALEPVSNPVVEVGQAQAGTASSEDQTADEVTERTFRALSRVKQNGVKISAGDPITLDRAGFEEMRRCRVVTGAFEDGTPSTAE
jgi:hypothetical protein